MQVSEHVPWQAAPQPPSQLLQPPLTVLLHPSAQPEPHPPTHSPPHACPQFMLQFVPQLLKQVASHPPLQSSGLYQAASVPAQVVLQVPVQALAHPVFITVFPWSKS